MGTKTSVRHDGLEELMKTMLIVQLGLAGVPQLKIRSIVGCDVHRVNQILKHMKKPKAENTRKDKR